MPDNDPIPDIKDIFPPPQIFDPDITTIVYIGLLIASSILLSYFLIIWLKIKKKKTLHTTTDHHKNALDELHDLKLNYTQIPAKEVASRIISSLRPLMSSQFGRSFLYLTTDEFLKHFKECSNELIGIEASEELLKIITACDQLRFSPSNDNNSERESLISNSIELVRNFPKDK